MSDQKRLPLPDKPATMYDYPAPRPEVQWQDFPKDMSFDQYQARAEAFGMHHTPNHGHALFNSAKNGVGQGYIVELGTYWGCGAAYLASGSKTVGREKVITVDIDRGHQWSVYTTQFWDRPPMQIYRAHMNWIMMGVYDWIIPIRVDSITASEILRIPVRLLHVDAGHNYNDCSWDVVSWTPLLIPNAVVVFHDRSDPGVAKVIADFVDPDDRFAEVKYLDNMTAITTFLG